MHNFSKGNEREGCSQTCAKADVKAAARKKPQRLRGRTLGRPLVEIFSYLILSFWRFPDFSRCEYLTLCKRSEGQKDKKKQKNREVRYQGSHFSFFGVPFSSDLDNGVF